MTPEQITNEVPTQAGDEPQAQCLEAGLHPRSDSLVASPRSLAALLGEPPHADAQAVQHAHRRGPRRLAVRGVLAVPLEVEVEAGRRGGDGRLPATRRDRDHREARRGHPRLL